MAKNDLSYLLTATEDLQIKIDDSITWIKGRIEYFDIAIQKHPGLKEALEKNRFVFSKTAEELQKVRVEVFGSIDTPPEENKT